MGVSMESIGTPFLFSGRMGPGPRPYGEVVLRPEDRWRREATGRFMPEGFARGSADIAAHDRRGPEHREADLRARSSWPGSLILFLSWMSFVRSLPGSIPADWQTSGKSFASRRRNSSATRWRLRGPEIHSCTVFAMTAFHSLFSGVSLGESSASDLSNIASPLDHGHCRADFLEEEKQLRGHAALGGDGLPCP
jgi:hypothetical protein